MAYIELSPSSAATASTVPFTPVGNIAATDVQAAIVELDNEKVAKAGDTMTGALKAWSGGIAAATAINFGTNGTGFFGTSTALLAATAGATRWSQDSVSLTVHTPIRAYDGVVGLPGLAFQGSIGSGIYYAGGVNISVGGTARLLLSTTAITSTLPVVLPADPTAALQAATKQYVDARLAKKNYVINGAMMVSQENGATAANSNAGFYFPVDQFAQVVSTTGVFTLHQNATVTPAGSPNRIRLTVTTADTSIATSDTALLYTRIEGYRAADLRFGASGAKTVTLQFGVRAPAGTYCVALLNSANNRNYVTEYVISAGEANTDVVKSVTIPGDTSGTWLKDNGVGLDIRWVLMAGTNFHVAAGTWLNSASYATANQFNWLGTNGNIFDLFDVSLTEGTTAPSFTVPDYADELLACQRYFQMFVVADVYMPVSMTTTSVVFDIPFMVPMRSGPAVTLPWTNANYLASPGTGQWALGSPGVTTVSKTGTITFAWSNNAKGVAAGIYGMTFSATATAIISGSALTPVKLDARM